MWKEPSKWIKKKSELSEMDGLSRTLPSSSHEIRNSVPRAQVLPSETFGPERPQAKEKKEPLISMTTTKELTKKNRILWKQMKWKLAKITLELKYGCLLKINARIFFIAGFVVVDDRKLWNANDHHAHFTAKEAIIREVTQLALVATSQCQNQDQIAVLRKARQDNMVRKQHNCEIIDLCLNLNNLVFVWS